MALIKCGECGKEFSDKANACPNCACPLERPKKKVIISKKGGLALRCNVFIDNQAVGQVGVGSNKSIELDLPIGTHYISTITQVKNQANIISSYNGNVMSSPITTSTSQEQDGKQFEITSNDELIEIEILTKGSFSGSTGRCIVGDIHKYNANESLKKQEEIKTDKQKETTKKGITNSVLNIAILFVLMLIIWNVLWVILRIGAPFVRLLLTLIITCVIGFIMKKKS